MLTFRRSVSTDVRPGHQEAVSTRSSTMRSTTALRKSVRAGQSDGVVEVLADGASHLSTNHRPTLGCPVNGPFRGWREVFLGACRRRRHVEDSPFISKTMRKRIPVPPGDQLGKNLVPCDPRFGSAASQMPELPR